jgi:glycosyltransferase involved in cell wall biosynthesis
MRMREEGSSVEFSCRRIAGGPTRRLEPSKVLQRPKIQTTSGPGEEDRTHDDHPAMSSQTETRYHSTRKGWSVLRSSEQVPAAIEQQYTAEEKAIAHSLDRAYYLLSNPDVAAANQDPVRHYANHGWKEGRNPSPSFDTRYYLVNNPDIAERQINPLLHYVMAGCAEGRRPSDKTEFRQTVLKNLLTAEEKTQAYALRDTISVLDDDTVVAVLREQLRGSYLVISISHDNYLRSVGGTQILISDEQRRFQELGADYLHLSPIIPRLRLKDPTEEPSYLSLILNGTELGCVSSLTMVSIFGRMADRVTPPRLLVCHCIWGHSVTDLQQLHRAIRPQRSIFWIHDYSSMCEGFNLLRNDVTFCGAPPLDSEACRICIHGPGRARHIAQVQMLFGSIAFDVVAPSEVAMEIWRSGSRLPCRSTSVIPHVVAEPRTVRRSLVPIEKRGTAELRVRVAFVGHAAPHKGWAEFLTVVREVGRSDRYQFYHFGTDDGKEAAVQHVPVSVSAEDRDAMRRALDEYAIDLVLVLSIWPETYSFVTYEAIAAGADVITFAESGNVAALVTETGRGIIIQDLHDLIEFFVSDCAVRYVRLCYQQGNTSGRLVCKGTAAAILPEKPLRTKAVRA